MRLVTWNCAGALRRKTAALDVLAADVLVIQECEDPASADYAGWAENYIWAGALRYKGIGVFARPEGGKEADEKVLYLQKHRITQAETTLELVVDELPFEAGIDPYNKLIDRNSGDNRKKAVLQ